LRNAFLLLAAAALAGRAVGAPYPPSPVITGITYDFSTAVRLAPGSDNWPVTWADDDHQYAAWGDGDGFDPAGTRVSLGVARIEGDWDDYRGYDVWGGETAENPAQFEGKSYGIICVSGVLYMWVSPGSGDESYEEARLCRSTNHGASWTQATWAFPGSEGLVMPTILNFGKDYDGARDGYVYHYFIEKKSSAWDVHLPGEVTLARVPRDEIMTRAAYEFYAGTVSGSPSWSADVSARVPVFVDPDGAGIELSVSYNAPLGRYLLITEHTASHEGRMGIFDAPEPWGPWTTVSYTSSFPGGETFFYNFSNKWLSADGRDFTLIYTGTRTEDAWHTVRGRFTVATESDANPPSVPGGLAVTGATTTTLDLAWSASTDAEGSTPITYQVESLTEGLLSGWQSARTYTSTGLVPGAWYTYRVRARDAVGNEGAWGDTAGGSTNPLNRPPRDPESVVASVLGSSSVEISWVDRGDPDGDPVSYYVEEVYDTEIASGWLAPGETTWVATNLAPGTTYRFQVRGRDDASPPATTAWVRANSVTTDGEAADPPRDPSGVIATSLGPSSIEVSWVDNGHPLGSPVEFYVQETTETSIASGWLPAGQTSWTATGLAAQTTYRFAVRGRDGADPRQYSAWVNSNEVTTDAELNSPPHDPDDVVAQIVGTDAVEIRWTAMGDPDGDTVQFRVEELHDSSITSGWLDIGAASWIATGLEASTTYAFTVRGRDDREPPQYTAVVISNEVTMPASALSRPDDPVPAFEGGVISLVWAASDDPRVVGYHVYRQQDGAETERRTDAPLVEPSFEDDGFEEGGGYSYWVTSVDAGDVESPPSGAVWIRASVSVPSRVFLEKIYPSPVRDEVTFRIGVPETGPDQDGSPLTVDLYDLAGKKIGRVLETTVRPGMREVSWRLSSLHEPLIPGMYFASVRVSGQTIVQHVAIAAK